MRLYDEALSCAQEAPISLKQMELQAQTIFQELGDECGHMAEPPSFCLLKR